MECPKCHASHTRTRGSRRIICLECGRTSTPWGVGHGGVRVWSGRKKEHDAWPKKYSVPLMTSPIAAWFPSPANDFIERPLDISEYLIDHPLSTFILRVKGDSMIGANIFDWDFVVVDKSIPPKEGKIVIATLDDAFTCKELAQDEAWRMYLRAHNPAYAPLYPAPHEELTIWGVVIARFARI